MKKTKLAGALCLFVCICAIASGCAAKEFSPQEIFAANLESIVELRCTTEDVGQSFGTAVFLNENGTLATNAHVVTYAQSGSKTAFENYEIRLATEQDYRAANLVKYDTVLDIAILEIADVNFEIKPVVTADSDKVDFGDTVYAIGNASNYGLSFTQGMVSMPSVVIRYDGKDRTVIQCDLTIAAGNSGGALLDARGQLIGITTFRTKDSAGNVIYGLAYSVPINLVMEYLHAKS